MHVDVLLGVVLEVPELLGAVADEVVQLLVLAHDVEADYLGRVVLVLGLERAEEGKE